jgi:hypothetical protein
MRQLRHITYKMPNDAVVTFLYDGARVDHTAAVIAQYNI